MRTTYWRRFLDAHPFLDQHLMRITHTTFWVGLGLVLQASRAAAGAAASALHIVRSLR